MLQSHTPLVPPYYHPLVMPQCHSPLVPPPQCHPLVMPQCHTPLVPPVPHSSNAPVPSSVDAPVPPCSYVPMPSSRDDQCHTPLMPPPVPHLVSIRTELIFRKDIKLSCVCDFFSFFSFTFSTIQSIEKVLHWSKKSKLRFRWISTF